jgi:uncharacterized protein with GYD domain
MAYYVILSRVSPGAFDRPEDFKALAQMVADEIRTQCPGLNIVHSFSTLGQFDVVDVVETDDSSQVERAAMIIRSYGKSDTQVLPAKPWQDFIKNL